MIDGVLVTPLIRIHNPKGDIFHAMKASSDGYIGFGEAYFSSIHSGEVKGWKRHSQATLNLIVIVGEIRFVVFNSGAHEFFEIILGPVNYSRLTVRPGLWVAFEGNRRENSILLNISSEEHDPVEAESIALSDIPYDWSVK